MRILIAGQTYFPAFNGQSIFMVNLAEGLAQQGNEVLAVVPSEQGKAHQEEHNGVRLERLYSVRLKMWHPDAAFAPFSHMATRRVFEEFRPEMVHIHDHYPLSWSAFLEARRRGIKVVGTNHFMPENLAPYFPKAIRSGEVLEKLLWRWMMNLYNRLDAVTAPSRTAAAILRHAGLRRPVYPISCGVDLGRFKPDPGIDRQAYCRRFGLDADKTLFFFVGRVDGEKRLDLLISSLKLLDRNDLQLVVAGKGAALPDLQKQAAALNLEDQVRFTGFVPAEDLPGLLNSVDVFAMPSEAELLSIATLEAMACGRPVLAARARALPELVSEGVNGLLFSPGDVADAARAMTELAAQRGRWKQMGSASLRKVQAHSLENTLRSYYELYEKVLAEEEAPVLARGSRAARQKAKAFAKTWPSR